MGDETITPNKLEVGKSHRDYLTDSNQRDYGWTIPREIGTRESAMCKYGQVLDFAIEQIFQRIEPGTRVVYTQIQAGNTVHSATVPAGYPDRTEKPWGTCGYRVLEKFSTGTGQSREPCTAQSTAKTGTLYSKNRQRTRMTDTETTVRSFRSTLTSKVGAEPCNHSQ